MLLHFRFLYLQLSTPLFFYGLIFHHLNPHLGYDSDFSVIYFTGQCIYPGKVTDADTFRVGNIGHLFAEDMKHLVECIKKVLIRMDVRIPVQY